MNIVVSNFTNIILQNIFCKNCFLFLDNLEKRQYITPKGNKSFIIDEQQKKGIIEYGNHDKRFQQRGFERSA